MCKEWQADIFDVENPEDLETTVVEWWKDSLLAALLQKIIKEEQDINELID